MALLLIKPGDLPVAASVDTDAAVMVQNGLSVEQATPAQVVNAGRPIASEAEAITGTDNTKAMTPLTVRQAIDADTSGSVAQAIAAAEAAEASAEAAESAAASTGLMGRNLMINGSGRINQRGYAPGAATSGANQFTLDRWFVVLSGESLTFTGDDSGRVMTAPAGGVAQVIEGANIVGGNYVLNWDGTATATVNGTARTKGETFTLTANTNVTVTFAGGTFTDVQLERGSVVTPFEWRSIGQELALCQRYYQTVRSAVGFAAAAGGEFASSSLGYVQKRDTPTITNAANVNAVNVSTVLYEEVSFNGLRFTAIATALGSCISVQDLIIDAELVS